MAECRPLSAWDPADKVFLPDNPSIQTRLLSPSSPLVTGRRSLAPPPLLSNLVQVSTHIKGVSQCYECETKQAPKGFPTCTITNTPSKVRTHALSLVCLRPATGGARRLKC